MTKDEHYGVLEDVAGQLAEQLREARPDNFGIDFGGLPPGVRDLLVAQHERCSCAVMKALVECGLSFPVKEYLELCKGTETNKL